MLCLCLRLLFLAAAVACLLSRLHLLFLLRLPPGTPASMDVMVTEEDTAEQARRIPTATRIHYDEWSHMDYTCECCRSGY